jgi:hypothetical protein
LKYIRSRQVLSRIARPTNISLTTWEEFMLRRLGTIFLLLVVVGSYGLSQAKPGGIARQISMGGSIVGLNTVLNPFIVDDPSRVLLNPAQQAKYRNYFWWNVGGGTLSGLSTADNGYGRQNAGISFGLGPNWTLGAILSYDPSAVNTVSTILQGQTLPPIGGTTITIPPYIPTTPRGAGVTGAQTIPTVNNVVQVLAAYGMGSLDLGLGFMYGYASNTRKSNPAPNQSTETEASAQMYGVTAGMNLDMGAGSSFSASGAYRMDKATDNVMLAPVVANQGGEYSVSGSEIQLDARLRLRMSNRVNFVPYGGFLRISAEPNEDAPLNTVPPRTDSRTLSTLAYALGAGAEYHTSTFYFAGGLSFQTIEAKMEFNTPPNTTDLQTFAYTAIPVINLGAEWWFTDWLAGRGGYYRASAKGNAKTEHSSGGATTTFEAGQPLTNSAVFVGGLGSFGGFTTDGLITLGIGLKFGGFSLDATVSEEALRRGLGLLGSADNLNSFGYITTSYSFD